MFSTLIRLTKFGPGFWSRVPGVGSGIYSFRRHFCKALSRNGSLHIKDKSLQTVGENDGPLLRFYLKSASAVWDYILSQNSIKKFFPLPVILGSLFTKYANGLLQAVTEVPTSTLA